MSAHSETRIYVLDVNGFLGLFICMQQAIALSMLIRTAHIAKVYIPLESSIRFYSNTVCIIRERWFEGLSMQTFASHEWSGYRYRSWKTVLERTSVGCGKIITYRRKPSPYFSPSFLVKVAMGLSMLQIGVYVLQTNNEETNIIFGSSATSMLQIYSWWMRNNYPPLKHSQMPFLNNENQLIIKCVPVKKCS